MKRLATDPNYRAAREAYRAFERSIQGFNEQIEKERKEVSTATATAPAQQSQANQPKASQPPPQQTTQQPLWSIPIEVLGLTGDFASGKTLFALSISPGPTTLIYDTEKSAKPYTSLGFNRIDLPGEMLKSHPGGFKPVDLFLFWWKDVKAIRPGKYRVIILDTVSEIESGLVAYVRANPAEFGYTSAQFARAQALVWGAVKDLWKAILTDLASRCETFAFTSHLKREFAGDRPTSNKTPKGKETLMELASLYLWLDRSTDKKGNQPAAPSATVLKSRLSSMVVLPNGLMDIRPSLPPRLPVATPASVRFYLDNPPDYDKLKADERIRGAEISEAEIEALKLARAEAERDAAALQLERMKSAAAAYQQPQRPVATGPQTTMQTPAPAPEQPANQPQATPQPSTNGHVQPASPSTPAPPVPNRPIDPYDNAIRDEQIKAIVMYRTKLRDLGMPDEAYTKSLEKRGVKSARDFNADQAGEFITALLTKTRQLEEHQQAQNRAAATPPITDPTPRRNGQPASF